MRFAPKYRSSYRRRVRRAVAAAARLVLAFAVLFGIVQSGGRYFYCKALGLLPFDPCTKAAEDCRSKSPLGMLSEHHADCCEVVTLAAMPQAEQAAGPSVAPAGRVAIVPALWLARRIDGSTPRRIDRAFDERWRPPPRASSDVRAQLMVFLI